MAIASQIVVKSVTKRFSGIAGREILAVQHLDLDVNGHEFVAILGPSGCGKSTLLNMIAGFEIPSAGTILVDGNSVKGPGPDRGVVFQEYGLFPWLTVHQNIAFGLKNIRVKAEEARSIVDEHVRLVQLQGFENTYPRELSGGMRQRVGIARVLAINPKILLMDEPFGALDALSRQQMQAELLEIWGKARKTVLFVTHSVEEALYLADRVVVMSPRPARILADIKVDLPRIRDVAGPDFNTYRREVSQLLHGG